MTTMKMVRNYLLMTLVAFSFTAMAGGTDTSKCAGTTAEVDAIVQQYYSDVFPNAKSGKHYVDVLVGTWIGGDYVTKKFSVPRSGRFQLDGVDATICPQVDGTFYIFENSDDSRAISAKYNGRQIIVSLPNGASRLSLVSMVTGHYDRYEIWLAKNKGNSSGGFNPMVR